MKHVNVIVMLFTLSFGNVANAEYVLVFSQHGRIEFQQDLNALLAAGCSLAGNLQVENNAMFPEAANQSPRFFAQGVICPDAPVAMEPPDEIFE